MPEPRAILFDLDDTLYPYRAFLRSGFRAVGRRLAEERGLPARSVLKVLRRALIGGERGRELQALCARFSLPASIVPEMVEVIREHTPALRLPRQTLRVLTSLRGSWRLGVVTNGTPRIQRRKVAALGLVRLVDTVVFATEHGDGTGKPDATPFQAALERLGTSAAQTVFVGDDRHADIEGASAVGMNTIHLWSRGVECDCTAAGAGVHVNALAQVPETADRLVPLRTESHVI
ncbi:MAG: HAD family hydrolase [Vicinamibacterales bacterium]